VAVATQPLAVFDPARYAVFRFLERTLDGRGGVTLSYALDDELFFRERFELPLARPLGAAQRTAAEPLLALLHWVAGVSYYKTAAPATVSFEGAAPGPAAAALLEALYSEGLAEFAYRNDLEALPRPRFGPPGEAAPGEAPGGEAAPGEAPGGAAHSGPTTAASPPRRALVPVGGGKDSAVALEIMRGAGCEELALFSIGGAPPILRTVAAAGLEHLRAERRLDGALPALNRAGALNGHVPVTAIVACAALLTAALHGFDTVAMANERSASRGSVSWQGVDVNHQFSKGLRAERLLRTAAAEAMPGLQLFSVLRGASELAIARAFARLPQYHEAFTSCNAVFRSDPERRASSWCCECPKCRFVFLALAPFSAPERLRAVFGRDLLDEEQQLEGFAQLIAIGGPKPFECVGEEQESIAALRLLAEDERWRRHAVVRRLARELPSGAGDPHEALRLADDHELPAPVDAQVRAFLGS
jgi:UDP-N-acetyl-alpha-D-muramoyl-L-alanyl-L-glutamate epimerase